MKKCGYASKYKGHIKPTCGCEYCNLLYNQKQAASEMYEALIICKNSLATYGEHPIIEGIINNALAKARGEL